MKTSLNLHYKVSRGHTHYILGHKRHQHNWFSWNRGNCKQWSILPILYSKIILIHWMTIVYIYIYIYIWRERERERESGGVKNSFSKCIRTNTPTESLQRGKTPTPVNVLFMTLNHLMTRLKSVVLWIIWSTLSLPLIPGPFSSGVVASDRIQSMGQIELFNI